MNILKFKKNLNYAKIVLEIAKQIGFFLPGGQADLAGFQNWFDSNSSFFENSQNVTDLVNNLKGLNYNEADILEVIGETVPETVTPQSEPQNPPIPTLVENEPVKEEADEPAPEPQVASRKK